MLLTRAPLYLLPEGNFRVRLACLRHAASVDSEPGSNSRYKFVLWNIIYYWSFLFSFDNDSCEFYANFIVHVLTLKGLETGHALSSFQTSIPNCIWIALQTIQTRPKQTGILTNDSKPVKPTNPFRWIILQTKKRRLLHLKFGETGT